MKNISNHINQSPATLVFFGHDRAGTAIKRRVWSLINAGVNVVGFMFSRDVNSYETRADWQKVDLGYMEHGRHGKRNCRILVAALGIIKARALIRNVDVAYARNPDFPVLA